LLQFCIHVFFSFGLSICADSARPPGMLTCHAVLLSLLKKSWKVFVTLFPRFPPLWPAPLGHRVLDVIKIATSLVVCFFTETIPSPMAKPWCHFPHKNWAKKSQKLPRCVKP
jgi:hypothetical protein